MMTLLTMIFIIITWTMLSTIVFKVMMNLVNDIYDPRVVLMTIFSPIGALILIGYGMGLLCFNNFNKLIK